jgi:hypothetical protein
MNLVPHPLPSTGKPPHPVEHPAPSLRNSLGGLPEDRDFGLMLARYQASGGLARGDDLARWMEAVHHGSFMSLAKLMASGEMLSFLWHDTPWVPMFQFEPGGLSLRPGPQEVFAVLAGTFDGWALAVWFTQPNDRLLGHSPVELLDSDLQAVLTAARQDRFIAG